MTDKKRSTATEKPSIPRRRDVLRLAVAGGAALISGCGAAPLAGGVGIARPGRGEPGPAGLRFGSPGPSAADWAALGRDLSGSLVRPGDERYGTARLLFDPRFDRLHPAGIAYCRSPQDVAACLGFARRLGVPVAARSGGHSYAGWSSTRGLVVDVTGMASVTVDTGSGTVVTGAGTRLIDLYAALAAHGVAVPGGSCPTVGIAGLTLGGGVGVLSGAYGLTSDNLLGMQIVTADGSVRACGPAIEPDLFWACRGGGGGNFGVATSFTFLARPLRQLTVFFVSWPWQVAAQVIAAWQHWAPGAPDELWSNLHLTAAPAGVRTGGAQAGGPATAPLIEVGGTHLGHPDDARKLLAGLYAAARAEPASESVGSSGFLDAMLLEAGCQGWSAGECHLPWQAPGGRFAREPQYAKSAFFSRPLPASGIRQLLASMERFRGLPAPPGNGEAVGAVAFDALQGAVGRIGAAETAFVHRDALFLAQYTTNWPDGARGANVAAQRAWLRETHATLLPYSNGEAYQNYIDPELSEWRAAYYGANYAKLARVKAAYDPGRLFSFPQVIGD